MINASLIVAGDSLLNSPAGIRLTSFQPRDGEILLDRADIRHLCASQGQGSNEAKHTNPIFCRKKRHDRSSTWPSVPFEEEAEKPVFVAKYPVAIEVGCGRFPRPLAGRRDSKSFIF